MGAMGYRRRTGFLAGLTVAQISEFSLIIAAMGLSVGHIPTETVGLITLVSVVTIFVSTYMILYSALLYERLSGALKFFERRNPYREIHDAYPAGEPVDVILLGLGHYGSELAAHLWRRGKSVIGVDFDPDVLERWHLRGMPVLYGDMADPELLEQLPLKEARWIVSAIPKANLNSALVQHLQDVGYQGRIALTAANPTDAAEYERRGVQAVFRPFVDAAEQAADGLTHAADFLPPKHDWPIDFREIRIRPEAACAGRSIREIPLREAAGVSVLAVGRAGRITFDPEPDFRIVPGDRVVAVGPFDQLEKAESILGRFAAPDEPGTADQFEITEIEVGQDSKHSGKTLAELRFKNAYKVTIVGIRRNERWIVSLGPTTRIEAGDTLLVGGFAESVAQVVALAPI